MNKAELLNEIMEFLERDDPIDENMLLDDIEEWDSMARLSFLSLIDAEFGINLTNDQILDAKKVADLIEFVKGKLEE